MYRMLLFVLLLALSAAGCSPRPLIHESKSLPQGVWTYADSLQFRASVRDTSRLYNIDILVKNGQDYGFQNLYLRVHTRFPQGKLLQQALSLELADKTGAWQGRCRGNACTLAVPIQQHAYFNEIGEYAFTLEQYMRQDSLPGILELGLRITDAGPRPK